MFETVRCIVCDQVGKWKNVDQYRYKAQGMCLCESCGFVTYPEVQLNQKDLEKFYEEEYRDPPSFDNVVTGERKLHYHAAFLGSLFDEWKKTGKENPEVFEVGAAFGMFLDWMRQIFPKGSYGGSELTKSFVRNAFHLYGLDLKSQIDESKKYDLIASYKVAEHQPDIDAQLKKYASLLKDGGLLYISVPTWFGMMHNFGAPGFNIEYYYSKNHVNSWSRNLFEVLLAKSGFEIVKDNHYFYDSTYLCKVNKSVSVPAIPADNAKVIEESLAKIFRAACFHDEAKYQDALNEWPNFPLGHVAFYEANRAALHKNGYEWIDENICKKAMEICKDSAVVVMLAADIAMRYSQWGKAIKYLEHGLSLCPNDPNMLGHVASCYRNMALSATNNEERTKFVIESRNVMKYVRQIAIGSTREAISWIMADNARLPTASEVATQ
jgi:SAM-dependent methyltransferase